MSLLEEQLADTFILTFDGSTGGLPSEMSKKLIAMATTTNAYTAVSMARNRSLISRNF